MAETVFSNTYSITQGGAAVNVLVTAVKNDQGKLEWSAKCTGATSYSWVKNITVRHDYSYGTYYEIVGTTGVTYGNEEVSIQLVVDDVESNTVKACDSVRSGMEGYKTPSFSIAGANIATDVITTNAPVTARNVVIRAISASGSTEVSAISSDGSSDEPGGDDDDGDNKFRYNRIFVKVDDTWKVVV